MAQTIQIDTTCFHCGEICQNELIVANDKSFCCEGCKLVFDILNENNLCSYYNYNSFPGTANSIKKKENYFAYLDNENVQKKLLQFSEGNTSLVTFFIPKMHCSSCIWLLENLSRINNSISNSRVNFGRKEVTIYFNANLFSLRRVVELLSSIGYEPQITLDALESKKVIIKDRSEIYRIGIAGFCFGNIMLFSFPEYFSIANSVERNFSPVFNYLNLFLSLPVFFYCSVPFFRFASQSLKQKFLNIDVPIALGIFVMFVRSAFEIISNTGSGYMDTMAGLTFFMLVGRYFQNKTYDSISFDRDYKSFFPISVMLLVNGTESSIAVSDITIGSRIVVRNDELIPADSILISNDAWIDFSFVTGESRLIYKKKNDVIFAGGKLNGVAIEIQVVKEVDQSYLTQLWNADLYTKKVEDSSFQLLVNRISHYFTLVIILISSISLIYWSLVGRVDIGWNAFTAVLIIACPCALAISSPFTLGNILRILGRAKVFLKNYTVVEKLAKVDVVVLDKTGTLTKNDHSQIRFSSVLAEDQKMAIASLVFNSSHPLSRMILSFLNCEKFLHVTKFCETKGKGLEGWVNNSFIKIGASSFVENDTDHSNATRVYLSINAKYIGYFSFGNFYRDGIDQMLQKLRKSKYDLYLLSGDQNSEKENLRRMMGRNAFLFFNQSPNDKMKIIKQLQIKGRNVLMIGDGLNDAGALSKADVGISVSDNINNFSPACDIIIHADQLRLMSDIISFAKSGKRIIYYSFSIALLYNVFGLYFAVMGQLNPLFAAILMPISSITIISFTTLLSNFIGRKIR